VKYLQTNPIIAILRGLQPSQAERIGNLLYEAGIRVMEVPLNRDNAFESIKILQLTMPDDVLVGAGTVTNKSQLEQLQKMSVPLIISPNLDVEIVGKTLRSNLISMPGVATVSEALLAYNEGARWLKLFPAASYGEDHLKAMLSILPDDVNFVAVGGVDSTNIQSWLNAGAKGVGIGNSIFSEDDAFEQTKTKVEKFMHIFQ